MRIDKLLERDSAEVKERLVYQLSKMSKEDLALWRQSPITQTLLQWIEAEHQALVEGWTAGAFFQENEGETLQKNAQALGMAYMCRELHNFIQEITQYGESTIQREASWLPDSSEA